MAEIERHRGRGGLVDEDGALFVAFSGHPHDAPLQVHVGQVQARDLGAAHAARVEHLEDGPVAQPLELGPAGRRRGSQQARDVVLGEDRRQAFGQLWRVDAGRRIVLAAAFDDQVAVETAQRDELATDRRRLVTAPCGQVQHEGLDVRTLGKARLAADELCEEFKVARIGLAGAHAAPAGIVKLRDECRDRRILGHVERLVTPPAPVRLRRLSGHT